jgi:quercetin dioxygenase-like cupin family protein
MSRQGAVQSINVQDVKRYSSQARVNAPLLSSHDLVSRLNCYEPGQITPMHIHPNDDEVILCLEGRGAITLADRENVPMVPGTLVSVPAGLLHGIAAAADSRMVVMYTTNAGYTSVRPSTGADGTDIPLPGENGFPTP